MQSTLIIIDIVGNELLAVTCSIYEKIKFWNVFEKKEIDTNNCFSGRILR